MSLITKKIVNYSFSGRYIVFSDIIKEKEFYARFIFRQKDLLSVLFFNKTVKKSQRSLVIGLFTFIKDDNNIIIHFGYNIPYKIVFSEEEIKSVNKKLTGKLFKQDNTIIELQNGSTFPVEFITYKEK